MSDKRYLIITEVFYPEDFLVNDLVFEWVNKGYKIEVLTRTPSYPLGKIFKGYRNKVYQKNHVNGVIVHRIPIIKGYSRSKIIKTVNYFFFALWGSIVAIFIGRRYEKVFVYQTGPLTVACPALVLGKIYRKKILLYSQDIWPETVYAYGFKKSAILSKLLDAFVKWVYDNSDKILVPSRRFSDKILHYVPQKQVSYVPNWSLVQSLSYSTDEFYLNEGINFTFAGNIGKVQNLEKVIKGFGRFKKRGYSKVTLNIIGDGSNMSHLKRLVENENILDIIFWGRQPIERMLGVFKASDVLIVSLNDHPVFELTIPSKFQAYLTAAKPIYAIINGQVKDLVEKNDIGLYADPSSEEDIADKFEEFCNMGKCRMSLLSKNASRLLEREFNRDILIKRISDLFF